MVESVLAQQRAQIHVCDIPRIQRCIQPIKIALAAGRQVAGGHIFPADGVFVRGGDEEELRAPRFCIIGHNGKCAGGSGNLFIGHGICSHVIIQCLAKEEISRPPDNDLFAAGGEPVPL